MLHYSKFWKVLVSFGKQYQKVLGRICKIHQDKERDCVEGRRKLFGKKKKTRKKIWKMWHIGNIWELYIKARGETCKVNIKIGQNENKCIVQCNPSETQHFASTMVTIYCGITTLHDSAKQISEVIILFTAVWKLAQWFSSSLRLNST